ncbi:MAG: phage tail assembly chaperone [Pseudomonadales bacterium]|jgi:hypothetical protein|nr:phage tail assembly chaperone [Pseudomonadales bacterium]
MAKFKFGEPPKTFDSTIKFTTLDKEVVDFGVTFNYRDKEELGTLQAETLGTGIAERRAMLKESEQAEVPFIQLASSDVDGITEYLMKAMHGWTLDVEFNRENVRALVKRYPAAAAAIDAAYRLACNEGRLGN